MCDFIARLISHPRFLFFKKKRQWICLSCVCLLRMFPCLCWPLLGFRNEMGRFVRLYFVRVHMCEVS